MTVKELLKKCQADKTAILATNFYNFETLTCVMKAAQKMQAPVLLQLTRSSIDYMGLEQTGVDALAVSIGSAHGFYKQAPKLDIERLAQIQAVTEAGLVLHGSSGIPHEMVQEAIANGIVKVNLATEIKDNFMRALKGVLTSSDEIDLRKVYPKAIDPVVDLLCEKYRMVGSAANK